MRRKSAESQIFVGRDHYPGGYRVRVRGGGIASKPRAGVLRIVACPGRRSVNVTVRPATAGAGNQMTCGVRAHHGKRRGGHR